MKGRAKYLNQFFPHKISIAKLKRSEIKLSFRTLKEKLCGNFKFGKRLKKPKQELR
jgi:hypothetical protein